MKGLLQEAQENVSAYQERLEVLKRDMESKTETFSTSFCNQLEKAIRIVSENGREEISVTVRRTQILIDEIAHLECSGVFQGTEDRFRRDLHKAFVAQLMVATRKHFKGFGVFEDGVQWDRFFVTWKAK